MCHKTLNTIYICLEFIKKNSCVVVLQLFFFCEFDREPSYQKRSKLTMNIMLFRIRNSLFTFWYSNIHTYFRAAAGLWKFPKKKRNRNSIRVHPSNDTIIYTSKNTILYIGSRNIKPFAKP